MPILLPEDYSYSLPPMVPVRQHFDHTHIEDEKIAGVLRETLSAPAILSHIRPGMRVAVAVGSRGIANIPEIVIETIRFLKEQGCEPFIVSAMGSHGGGTEEGQRQVLEGYGITEKTMGVPIVTSVDTICLGTRKGGIPVYFDRAASEADMVVPIKRIKLHTDFDGPIQSGLCKMLVIGLGNQKGCSQMHETPPSDFARGLLDAARLILSKVNVGFGVAVMENAYDETCHLEAVPSEMLISREEELAQKCRSLMPFIRINHADVLVVDEIGKDISGAGFDPNILGRSCMLYVKRLPVPDFQRMVLLGLTEASHGNAIGIGYFDVVTKNVVDAMDMEQVYANALACRSPEDARIPVTAKDREEAIRIALKCCRDVHIDRKGPGILEIRNTADLDTIWVSPALLSQVKEDPALEILG